MLKGLVKLFEKFGLKIISRNGFLTLKILVSEKDREDLKYK